METPLTITLPPDLQTELDALIQAKGISSDELVIEAIEDYLFVRKFRSLRTLLIQKAQQGYTDEDIFEMVS
jgi:metal-responsive CopG/Arc/MetJ family transcriptional regulator